MEHPDRLVTRVEPTKILLELMAFPDFSPCDIGATDAAGPPIECPAKGEATTRAALTTVPHDPRRAAVEGGAAVGGGGGGGDGGGTHLECV